MNSAFISMFNYLGGDILILAFFFEMHQSLDGLTGIDVWNNVQTL